MKIKKAHCFFEQSGTFKNAFKHYGIDAEDYDIQNNFGETDNVIDLFAEIEKGYDGKPSIFDRIEKDDLIMAFFPCIEFSCVAQMWFSAGQRDYRNWKPKRMVDYMLNKIAARSRMFDLLYRFIGICVMKKIPMVFENPWGLNTYLKTNVFFKKPDVVDANRSIRGDLRIKPTAYWFFNCAPTYANTFQRPKGDVLNHNQLKKAPQAGLCSEERSMISPDYALNFINDFLLGGGKRQGVLQQVELF
jgi:hypothetical protein